MHLDLADELLLTPCVHDGEGIHLQAAHRQSSLLIAGERCGGTTLERFGGAVLNSDKNSTLYAVAVRDLNVAVVGCCETTLESKRNHSGSLSVQINSAFLLRFRSSERAENARS
jgi:hypothetical protein